MSMRLIAAAAVPLFIVACGDSPVAPTPEATMAPLFAATGAKPSATGSGSILFGAYNRSFSFSARMRPDGTVEGQWQRVTHNGGPDLSKSHGEITCLAIAGNQAWIGGFKTSGAASEPPNNEVAWRVIDNGQGSGAEPDQISGQAVGQRPGFAAAYCETMPATGLLFDLKGGNIQVRP